MFLPHSNLYSIPFNIFPSFLCLSQVEGKDTQSSSNTDIIWTTLVISLYINILLSLCTQTVFFLILCKWWYLIGMLTVKDPPGFLLLTKLSEPFYIQVLCYLFHWYCWEIKMYKNHQSGFAFTLSFIFIYMLHFLSILVKIWFLLGFIISLLFLT